VSAADRYACPECSEIHERVCARIAADRIRELEEQLRLANIDAFSAEAELEEERDTTSRRISSADGLRFIAERDRDALKAELAEARKSLEAAGANERDLSRKVCVARDERDAVIAREQAAQAERDSHLQRYLRTREHLDAAQVDAAAMREVLGWMQGEVGLFIKHIGYAEAIEKALDGTAGRAIAHRLPLWRELQRAIRERDWRAMDDMLAKLAALDAKEPK
jgi:hypothetical protein